MGFVQGKQVSWSGGSGTTESVTFTVNVTAGNLVALFATWITGTSNITSIKDGNNISYRLVNSLVDASNVQAVTYYLSGSAGGTGPSTITITWNADPGSGFIFVQEISGYTIVDANAIKALPFGTSGTNAVTSGSVTTSAPDFIFAAAVDTSGSNANWTAGTTSAFTGVGNATGVFAYNEYFEQSSAGSIAGTFTYSLGQSFIAAVVAFRALPPTAAFPGTPILDTFIRANEDPVSNGGKWSNPIFPGHTAMRVVSNQLTSPTTSSDSYWSASVFGPDSEAYADLLVLPNNGIFSATIAVRLTSEGTSGNDGIYIAWANTPAGAQWDLVIIVNNAVAIEYHFDGTMLAGDSFGISAVGNLITFYRKTDGIWYVVGSVTDNNVLQRGHIGVHNDTSVSGATPTYANFGGGTFLSDRFFLQGNLKLQ